MLALPFFPLDEAGSSFTSLFFFFVSVGSSVGCATAPFHQRPVFVFLSGLGPFTVSPILLSSLGFPENTEFYPAKLFVWFASLLKKTPLFSLYPLSHPLV